MQFDSSHLRTIWYHMLWFIYMFHFSYQLIYFSRIEWGMYLICNEFLRDNYLIILHGLNSKFKLMSFFLLLYSGDFWSLLVYDSFLFNFCNRAQVVGWPPIRSFRKNTMATSSAKNNDDCEGKVGAGCLYVKVSMDGAPYLRKVDLKIYSNYMELSSALEKMFSCFTIGTLSLFLSLLVCVFSCRCVFNEMISSSIWCLLIVWIIQN